MEKYLQKIEAIGIYQKFDIIQDFYPGINIIYGINGQGKTTIAHILSNLLNGYYRRFLYLDFVRIKASLNNGDFIEVEVVEREDNGINKVIEVKRNGERSGQKFTRNYDRDLELEDIEAAEALKESSNLKEEKSLLPTAYFPAFRTMIDAWASMKEDMKEEQIQNLELVDSDITSTLPRNSTQFARKIFGKFIPYINYPSLVEIEHKLSDKLRQLIVEIAKLNNEVFSQSFLDIFSALFPENTPINFNLENKSGSKILEEIKILTQNIHNYPLQDESVYLRLTEKIDFIIYHSNKTNSTSTQFISVLNVYKEALERISNTLENSFSEIKRYLSAVNGFLNGKKIIYAENLTSPESLLQIKFDDGSLYDGLSALSSGERQVATLIYAATNMRKQNLVLIDEPEISLHVDWQRKLLTKMSGQLSERQIIAFTHSPIIPADFDDRFEELNSNPTNPKLWHRDNEKDSEYLEDNILAEEDFFKNIDDDITADEEEESL